MNKVGNLVSSFNRTAVEGEEKRAGDVYSVQD